MSAPVQQFGQRQIRDGAGRGRLTFHQHFVHVAQDVLHGLKIKAPARDVARLGVLHINFRKALGFALRHRDLLRLVGFGLLNDALGGAAGFL